MAYGCLRWLRRATAFPPRRHYERFYGAAYVKIDRYSYIHTYIYTLYSFHAAHPPSFLPPSARFTALRAIHSPPIIESRRRGRCCGPQSETTLALLWRWSNYLLNVFSSRAVNFSRCFRRRFFRVRPRRNGTPWCGVRSSSFSPFNGLKGKIGEAKTHAGNLVGEILDGGGSMRRRGI